MSDTTHVRTDPDLSVVHPRTGDEMPDLDLPAAPRATVARGDSGPDVAAVHGYLARYGYFPSTALATRFRMWRPGTAFDVPDATVLGEEMALAVRLFQGAQGLEQTGEVDEATLALMARPRCGVPDTPVAHGLTLGAFVAQGNRWPGPTVSYSHDGFTPDLSAGQVRTALRGAFDRWQAVVPLGFTERPSGTGDIRITFASGDHGDGNAFDGAGGTLAHCFFPPPNGGAVAGDCHFDEAETWTVGDPVTGIDLDSVALHELGHGIGLDHSADPSAVMYAYYGGPRRELHPDDVAGAQSIYGRRFRWGSLGGVITSGIAVADNADGRLEVFARGTDGALYHQWQTRPSAGPWSGWSSLGGSIVGTPTVGRNADGRLEVFARGLDGALWHRWQQRSGGWSGWASLGGVVTSPVVGRNADGRLEVFARGTDGAVWHAWQVRPNGSWSGWGSLSGVITTGIAVGNNADGRLELFVRGTDGAVWHRWQTRPSAAPWSRWTSRGGRIIGTPAVGNNADGRLEVFARGTDSGLFHTWQGAPNGTWGGWSPLGGVLTSDPTVAANADGRLEVFGRGSDRALWHLWQTAPDGGWSGWATLSGGTDLPVATRNRDGRLEVFVKGDDGAVWNTWQSVPDGPWS